MSDAVKLAWDEADKALAEIEAFTEKDAKLTALRAENERLHGEWANNPLTHQLMRHADMGWAEVEKLRAALVDARESVEAWAAYASDYFKEKHDLAGDLARIDAALEGKE